MFFFVTHLSGKFIFYTRRNFPSCNLKFSNRVRKYFYVKPFEMLHMFLYCNVRQIAVVKRLDEEYFEHFFVALTIS